MKNISKDEYTQSITLDKEEIKKVETIYNSSNLLVGIETSGDYKDTIWIYPLKNKETIIIFPDKDFRIYKWQE